MKNFIITTCAILMVSLTANACGGITIKGNSGASYCLSKHVMNWYSAYAWCEAQGMKLIDLDSVCKSYNSCSELKLSSEQQKHITDNGGAVDWTWTNTSSSSKLAFNISLSSGNFNPNHYYSRLSHFSALCF